MRAIINGKRYDTKTAEQIGDRSGDGHITDFRYWCESLYKTKRGAWFVAGEGGPMTRYARSTGQNSWCGSSGIRPLTPDEARTWLEEGEFWDEIETHFADEIEDA